MFYMIDQNNSGGRFVTNDKLCHRLIIEANSEDIAREIALDMGVYFDGVDNDKDCACCGDRWYDSFDEIKIPYKHLEGVDTVEEYAQYLADEYGWTTPDIRIFYSNGDVKQIFKSKKKD